MTIFETERLVVREVKPEDVGELLGIYSKAENMCFISSGKYNWTKEELCEKYAGTNKDYEFGFGIFVVEQKETKKIIGEAALFNSFKDHKKLELGYIIDSMYWENGFGKEIAKGLIDYSFVKLSVRALIARMYAKNSSSVRLSEKCGMTRIEDGTAENGERFFVYEIKKENNS